MIDYIKGEIVELAPARMLLECNGIGYEINISLTTFTAFQGKPEGKIYIYEVIREDAHLLYGFSTLLERNLYLLLTSVSGVGPNTARTILSSLQPQELVQVIATKDEVSLTAVKGIGAKTAQRILVDLKSKVSGLAEQANYQIAPIVSTTNAKVAEEAEAALVMLGFQKAASQKAVISILKKEPAAPVEQVIKLALKML